MLVGGLMVTGALPSIAIDVVLLSVLVTWLVVRPGLAPVLALVVVEVLSIGVNVFQINDEAAAGLEKPLLLHLLLRVTAIVLLAVGHVAFRKQAAAVPVAAVARVFE